MRTRFGVPVSLVLGVLIPCAATAQMGLGGATSTTYGVILGANASSVSETFQAIKDLAGAAVSTKRRVGLNAGIFVNKSLFGGLSLQPEAHYTQTGVTYNIRTTTTPVTTGAASLKLDYVEVPVLLRLDLGKNASRLHPFLYAGASGAFRITCEIGSTINTTTVTTACSENTTSTSKDPIEKYDMNAIGGAGFSISALGRSYSLSGRYSRGLQKLSTETTGAQPKNSVFSVQLGIGF